MKYGHYRGSYVHNSMVEFSGGIPKMFYAIFAENWSFQTKRFAGLLDNTLLIALHGDGGKD